MEAEWMNLLDDRQKKELSFAKSYKYNFSHGTDGHHRLCLIALLAEIIDGQEQYIHTLREQLKK